MSGSQLVARLLHITPSSTGSLSERGIVGVLQTPAASTSAQTVSFDRDRETSLLSPCRRRYTVFHLPSAPIIMELIYIAFVTNTLACRAPDKRGY